MSMRIKFLTFYTSLFMSFNAYALHVEDKNPEKKLKALATTRICEGLSQLCEVSEELRNLIDHIDRLQKIKDDYYQKIEPAFEENYKRREEIEDDLAGLEDKERSSCTFLELHSDGPCARIENPSLRIPINKKIAIYNEKSHELAPALEHWSSEYRFIEKNANLIESGYKKARKALEEGIKSYWNAIVSVHLEEGHETIEGVLTKPLTFDDEQLFLDCVSSGLDLWMTEIIFDIRMSTQKKSGPIRWYRNRVQHQLAKITGFNSPFCTRQLDLSSLLETIIFCKQLKP